MKNAQSMLKLNRLNRAKDAMVKRTVEGNFQKDQKIDSIHRTKVEMGKTKKEANFLEENKYQNKPRYDESSDI